MRICQFCLMGQNVAQGSLTAQKQDQFSIQKWDR